MKLTIQDAPLFSMAADWSAACHASDWPTPTPEQQRRIDETCAQFRNLCAFVHAAAKDAHGSATLANEFFKDVCAALLLAHDHLDMRRLCISHTSDAAVITRAIARLRDAAQPALEVDTESIAPGELDPQTAIETARRMLAYCQSFNGQAWGGPDESVDRKNLAVALDNLEDMASMLLNMAGRVQHPTAMPSEDYKEGWMDGMSEATRLAVPTVTAKDALGLLTIEEDDAIVLRLTADAAASSFTNDPKAQTTRPAVTDKQQFLRDVFSALTSEREDGSTRLTDVLDWAEREAWEQGSLGLAEG